MNNNTTLKLVTENNRMTICERFDLTDLTIDPIAGPEDKTLISWKEMKFSAACEKSIVKPTDPNPIVEFLFGLERYLIGDEISTYTGMWDVLFGRMKDKCQMMDCGILRKCPAFKAVEFLRDDVKREGLELSWYVPLLAVREEYGGANPSRCDITAIYTEPLEDIDKCIHIIRVIEPNVPVRTMVKYLSADTSIIDLGRMMSILQYHPERCIYASPTFSAEITNRIDISNPNDDENDEEIT